MEKTTVPTPCYFTKEYVAAAFERAGQTLLSQPITGARPSGYRSVMLEIVREVTEAYGYSEETVHSPVSSPAAVSEMDPVLGWQLAEARYLSALRPPPRLAIACRRDHHNRESPHPPRFLRGSGRRRRAEPASGP
jgi:hypothetical protein